MRICSGIVGAGLILKANFEIKKEPERQNFSIKLIGMAIPQSDGCLAVLPDCDSCVARSIDIKKVRGTEGLTFLSRDSAKASRHWSIPSKAFMNAKLLESSQLETMFTNAPIVYRITNRLISEEFRNKGGIEDCLKVRM